LQPSAIRSLFSGFYEEIVFYNACYSTEWLGQSYSPARCEVGCPGDPCPPGEFDTLLRRLDGQEGQEKRIITSALSGLGSLRLLDNGQSNLAPTVLAVSPRDGDIIRDKVHGHAEFDSEMMTDRRDYPHPLSVVSGPAFLENVRWVGTYTLEFDLTPYGSGYVNLRLGDDCVSASHTRLDGNQRPLGTNGVGPGWTDDEEDPYVWTVYADHYDPNSAAAFGEFRAFWAEDGVHVIWVTDPEAGSREFRIWAGTGRRQLLKTVPAVGGALPHFYEAVVRCDSLFFEVTESDVDPSTPDDGTRPFRISLGPPADLDDLRRLNQVVASWPVLPDTLDRPVVEWPAPGDDRSICVTDFEFYTSRTDFLEAAMPVIDWLYRQGWTVHAHVGGSAAGNAQYQFRVMYEYAMAHGAARPPTCVIIGEANEGDHPERNIVGTFYVPDDDQQCYWNSCASDLEMTNFYNDGPRCPYTRVVASTVDELTNCVASTLEYYNNIHVMPERVEALVGDLNGMCDPLQPPGATMGDIVAWYRDRGVPVVRLDESLYEERCYDYQARQDTFCLEVNRGVTELIGTGRISSRSILPGFFCQKVGDPAFVMSNLPVRQRIVCQLPGCGMADADRSNPYDYPGLAKMYLTADPDGGTSAVAWLSHSRGGAEGLHHAWAREYFRARLEEPHHYTVQELHWSVIRRLWEAQPTMRPFLRQAMAFGFPIQFPGYLTPAAQPVADRPVRRPSLEVSGTPGAAPRVWYELSEQSPMRLAIYDVTGREVRVLVTADLARPAGRHEAAWDARDGSGQKMPNGLYLVRLEVGGRVEEVRKLVLIK